MKCIIIDSYTFLLNQIIRNIVFEKEAYLMDHDLNYLKNRKFWSFLRFYKIPCK